MLFSTLIPLNILLPANKQMETEVEQEMYGGRGEQKHEQSQHHQSVNVSSAS